MWIRKRCSEKKLDLPFIFLQEPRDWILDETGQPAGVAFKAECPWSQDVGLNAEFHDVLDKYDQASPIIYGKTCAMNKRQTK